MHKTFRRTVYHLPYPCMRHFTIRWAAYVFLLIPIIFSTGSTDLNSITTKKRYLIADGSKLYLKGTSNVNAFTCDCEDQYTEQTLEVERTGPYARFRNVDLHLRTKRFDCHNRKIDADMQKALQADVYPVIKVSLLDARQPAKCVDGGCKDWFDVQAKVKLTIKNVTTEQQIPAQAKISGPNRFQLKGAHTLLMSTYGVHPPEAMFGLIKVNDAITFHFDLIVQVYEAI